MIHRHLLVVLVVSLALLANAAPLPIDDYFTFITKQYSIVYSQWQQNPTKVPDTGYPAAPEWKLISPTAPFTGGFYAGINWYIYAYNTTTNIQWAKQASLIQVGTAPIANNTQTHDIGFNIIATYILGYTLIKDITYLPIIYTAAKSLSTRYNHIVGCTRSWNSPNNNYYTNITHNNINQTFNVIIDNLMNLELLYFASIQFNNLTWSIQAINHSLTTINNHFRLDNSTFHLIIYNETNGVVIQKRTVQGYADWSTWARGQSWAIYGYTMSYRYTRYTPFLDKAIGATKLFLDRLQETQAKDDTIPLWDFDSPPSLAVREVSAAVVVASALLELSQYDNIENPTQSEYFIIAEYILGNVSLPKYSLNNNNNNYLLPALLTQSNGAVMNQSAVSMAITYSEYYYVQALIRYKTLINRQNNFLQLNNIINREKSLLKKLNHLTNSTEDLIQRIQIMTEFFHTYDDALLMGM